MWHPIHYHIQEIKSLPWKMERVHLKLRRFYLGIFLFTCPNFRSKKIKLFSKDNQ